MMQWPQTKRLGSFGQIACNAASNAILTTIGHTYRYIIPFCTDWIVPMRIQCPECSSDAVYKYGHTSAGKQRFLCLLCERQFIVNRENLTFKKRPSCPACGKPMHSYMKSADHIRFRCSDYPQCKTYLKVSEVEFEVLNAEMLSNAFRLKQFIKEIEGKPTWEAIHLANEEATAAERFLMTATQLPDKKRKKIKRYINKLTDFMLFIRSAITIPRTGKKTNKLFWQYKDSISAAEKKNGRAA
jgi:transposase-like protein